MHSGVDSERETMARSQVVQASILPGTVMSMFRLGKLEFRKVYRNGTLICYNLDRYRFYVTSKVTTLRTKILLEYVSLVEFLDDI